MSGFTSRASFSPASPVRSGESTMPGLREVVLEHLAQIGLVFDHEHPSHGRQRRRSVRPLDAVRVTFASRLRGVSRAVRRCGYLTSNAYSAQPTPPRLSRSTTHR